MLSMPVRKRPRNRVGYLFVNNYMKEALDTIIQHLTKEFSLLQVGRANPAMLDDIMVEAYNVRTALNQLASISSQGAQMLIVQPWDHSILKDIERALRTCGRDYNPVVDGTTIRLPFPPLTEEKRKDIVKLMSEKAQDAHIQIKRWREEQMHSLKTQKANKEISEDAWAAQQKEVQKLVDQANDTVEKLSADKEANIMKL